MRCFSFAVPFVLALPALAQATWIVDAAGGGNFTDIPAALAAAAPGDTLLVRPGTYTPGTTSKGVRLIGGPGVYLTRGPFTVQGLPADQTFVMVGFESEYSYLGVEVIELRLISNNGRVHLEDVRTHSVAFFAPSLLTPISGPAVNISHCAHVSLNRCALLGHPAMRVALSTTLLTDSRVGCDSTTWGWSQPGMELSYATVRLSNTDVSGSGGISGGWTAATNTTAIIMLRGTLRIAGDATTAIQGGVVLSPWGGPPGVQPAIVSDNGLVEIDPLVMLNPTSDGWPPTRGTSTYVFRSIPSLTAAGVAPGGTLDPALVAPAGHTAAMFVSLPAEPRFELFDELWLDLGTAIALGGAVVPPGGVWSNPHSVPAQYYPAGTTFLYQCATLSPTGEVAFSTPVEPILK